MTVNDASEYDENNTASAIISPSLEGLPPFCQQRETHSFCWFIYLFINLVFFCCCNYGVWCVMCVLNELFQFLFGRYILGLFINFNSIEKTFEITVLFSYSYHQHSWPVCFSLLLLFLLRMYDQIVLCACVVRRLGTMYLRTRAHHRSANCEIGNHSALYWWHLSEIRCYIVTQWTTVNDFNYTEISIGIRLSVLFCQNGHKSKRERKRQKKNRRRPFKLRILTRAHVTTVLFWNFWDKKSSRVIWSA